MKKIIIFTTAVFFAIISYSQVQYGVSVGYNTLSINSENFELEKPGTGFNLGLSYKYLYSDNFNALLEWDYFNTKLNFESLESIQDWEVADMTLQGFRYHLLGNYNFHENAGILLGPSGEVFFPSKGSTTNIYEPEYNIGLTAGIIGTYDKFTIDARYTYGLMQTFEHGEYNEDTDNYGIEGSQNVFNVRLTYYFYQLNM